MNLFANNFDCGDDGVMLYRAAGCSMWPFLAASDILVAKKVAQSNLKIGDLIVFSDFRHIKVVHRIVHKYRNIAGQLLYLTKGDANHYLDQPICYADIIGKVFFVKKTSNDGVVKLRDLGSIFCVIFSYVIARGSYYWIKVKKKLHFLIRILRVQWKSKK